ncbi:MAG: hypothetical protein EXS58_15630 [Candidatus Latescibacteria bacterium]|nr:hypothetical protein [Candidatus Latescibacterota bacterium]
MLVNLIWYGGLVWWWMGSPLQAADSLGVGWSGSYQSWIKVRESSQLLSFSPDSVWMWSVAANSNLGPGVEERGGFLLFPGDVATFLGGAQVMYDSDAATAFDPDDWARTTELKRTSPLYLDLGSTFGVNHIRFYPRLDEEHKHRFLRSFSLATDDGLDQGVNLLEREFKPLVDFYPANPNREPLVEVLFPSRQVRYIRLTPRENLPWEVAELEIYSDGTLPVGEFVSQPIFSSGGPRPLWGRVRYEGRGEEGVVVQTRTGLDLTPRLFYRLTGVGADRERVTKTIYDQLQPEEKGPVLNNPQWTPWQTATDGTVRSPGNRPYIQFRLLMNKPGIMLRRIVIEYYSPPIAADLAAEISPLEAGAGQETVFTISMRAQFQRFKSDGSLLKNADTGFQRLRILSDAQITGVEQVMVDDMPTRYTASLLVGQGAAIRFSQRLVQDGTFIQIRLRARLFRDATAFQVEALDQRVVDGQLVQVQQDARQEDVDPVSLGGSLVVRLEDERLRVLGQVQLRAPVFTPNGDGANELFTLDFDLLKLTRSVPVVLEIFDLGGHRLRRLELGRLGSGSQTGAWDGRDEAGQLAVPGLYLYRLQVEADSGTEHRQGVVGVGY